MKSPWSSVQDLSRRELELMESKSSVVGGGGSTAAAKAAVKSDPSQSNRTTSSSTNMAEQGKLGDNATASTRQRVRWIDTHSNGSLVTNEGLQGVDPTDLTRVGCCFPIPEERRAIFQFTANTKAAASVKPTPRRVKPTLRRKRQRRVNLGFSEGADDDEVDGAKLGSDDGEVETDGVNLGFSEGADEVDDAKLGSDDGEVETDGVNLGFSEGAKKKAEEEKAAKEEEEDTAAEEANITDTSGGDDALVDELVDIGTISIEPKVSSAFLKDFACIGSDKLDSSSSIFKVYLFLLADLLGSTNRLVDFYSSKSPCKFLVNTFGAEYIMEFMGRSLFDGGDFLDRLVNEFMEAIAKVGYNPLSSSAFLLSLFEVEESSETSPALPLSGEAYSVRLQSNELQVNFFGEDQGRFFPTDARTLRLFLSEEGTVNIILQLLCNPEGFCVRIPAGHRDDEDEDEQEVDGGYGCFKGAMLLSPLLSPSGRKRLNECLNDTETSNSKICDILQSKVKTIAMKKVVGKNAHYYAMNKNENMIGVFHSGQGKHCVFIDGHANNGEGTISDPVKKYGRNLRRRSSTLRQMSISRFNEVYILKRVHLSEKTRKKHEKKLNLPFFDESLQFFD
ncbi:hypothetical protein ACHAWC_002555 [Mediolabrus comicus]